MADIVYTVNYDETNGVYTTTTIEKFGPGGNDRVRFETTTTEYKMALRRDKKKNPKIWPFSGVDDPYAIPKASAKPDWMDVKKSGKTGQFHYICGQILKDGKFEAWPQPNSNPNPKYPVKTSVPIPPLKGIKKGSVPIP